MADCSASGTAIDRVIQSAVASALNQGNNGASTSSAAAASAATRAFGNFFGGTAATASSSGPTIVGNGGRMAQGGASAAMGGHVIMPLTPLEAIGEGGLTHRQGGMVDSAVGLGDVGAASRAANSNPAQQYTPTNNHLMYHEQQHQIPMQQQMPLRHHAAPPQMMMQQQQMIMMQHMQMQQHQMAAMVQYQKEQQQQHQQQKMEAQKPSAKNRVSTDARADGTAEAEATAVDDDVATVSEEEQLHHEGITGDASIERLAQAWRDAEAEFADEFGDDEYDVSDMGGLWNQESAMDAAAEQNNLAAAAHSETAEPQYAFSEASRAYGCLRTESTDVAPGSLDYPDNLYERGLRHFDDGDIPTAILCFESALRNVDPEHADSWRMLGRCHTENDEDRRAIACWLRSLERDPFSPETLLALGVAYVNELDHERAVETLRGWVANHPLYAGMIDDADGGGAREEDLYGGGDGEEELDGEVDGGGGAHRRGRTRSRTMAEMRDVERLLLRALEYNSAADAAADVYEALGVVYNVSRDYDAAANAFRRAIDVRPGDYQLRNKLGATLANGDRSGEALPSYSAALRLKPKYARGWLNMAIAHSNLQSYDEAARCYLQTLSLNPEARHVWSYLRIALTCEERWDLLPLAAAQDLSAFHDHFDFVEY